MTTGDSGAPVCEIHIQASGTLPDVVSSPGDMTWLGPQNGKLHLFIYLLFFFLLKNQIQNKYKVVTISAQ